MLDGGDHETGGAIDQLTGNRGKKAATQVGKTAAAATTGFFTGAAVGTAIPVPILGTVVGALVGSLAGFAAGKAVEIFFGDKALQDPISDYQAVLKLHAAVLAGDAAALQALSSSASTGERRRAPDGWKARSPRSGRARARAAGLAGDPAVYATLRCILRLCLLYFNASSPLSPLPLRR